MVALLTASEKAVLEPPKRVRPSEWAFANRRLTSDSSAEAGPYDLDRTPYWREVLDAFARRDVQKITIVAAGQVGKTELLGTMLMFAVDADPGPAIYGMPRDDDIAYILKERFRRSFEASPGAARHLVPGKWISVTDQVMSFDTMPVYLVSAASPAALASRPCRYAFLDEVDKWPRFSGREADPVSLILVRTRNFPDRKIVQTSTPTLKHGYIWTEFAESLQHEFWVPCPHCGRYQFLTWSHVKFPQTERDPKRIRDDRLAWVDCEHCHGRIEDQHKPAVLLKGRWVAQGQRVNAEGQLEGDAPASSHVGYHISALYSPWMTFSEVAAEFLEAQNAPEKLMSWRNSTMAEPWEERALELTDERLLSHVGTHERGTAPQFVQLLTAGVDVHGYGHTFNVIIRGWGWAEESALILSAEVENWQGIEQLICHSEYPRASREGVSLRVGLCAIDSGYRTHEVYDFCRTWAHVCRATKGQSGSHMTGPMKPSIIDYHPVRGRALRNALTLWHLNVDYYKDKLHALLNVSHGDPGYFWLCFGVDDTYAKQLTSETKVIRYDRRGRPFQVWEAAYRGAANHFLDAEIYALAAADMAGALTLPRLAPEEGTPSGREALHREPFVGGGRDWWHQHR